MLRILAAGAVIAAIVGQFVVSWSMVPDRAAFIVNFFSFFTILSNALTALVLLVGAWIAFTRSDDPAWFNLVRACAVTYMATTFVVYNLLLREISLDQATTVPWSNEILHVWAPLYLVADWVLAPGGTASRGSGSGRSRCSRSRGSLLARARRPHRLVPVPVPESRRSRRATAASPSTSSRSRRSSCSSARACSRSAARRGRTRVVVALPPQSGARPPTRATSRVTTR